MIELKKKQRERLRIKFGEDDEEESPLQNSINEIAEEITSVKYTTIRLNLCICV